MDKLVRFLLVMAPIALAVMGYAWLRILLEEWNEAGTQGESDDDDPDGDERDAL